MLVEANALVETGRNGTMGPGVGAPFILEASESALGVAPRGTPRSSAAGTLRARRGSRSLLATVPTTGASSFGVSAGCFSEDKAGSGAGSVSGSKGGTGFEDSTEEIAARIQAGAGAGTGNWSGAGVWTRVGVWTGVEARKGVEVRTRVRVRTGVGAWTGGVGARIRFNVCMWVGAWVGTEA